MNKGLPVESVEQIEQAASEWFFRRDGGFTPDEARAFAEWIEDHRHRTAFSEIERTWGRLREARPLVAPDTDAAWRRSRSLLVGRWLPIGLAAAAAIVLVVWWGRSPSRPRVEFAAHAATEGGGLRRLDLPDGSFVTLNANSSLDVQFTAAGRRVDLRRGEAHFEVAKQPSRPFVVEATGVAVQAVGTAFSVRVNASAVDVLVIEGRVRVDDAGRGASLLRPPPKGVAGEMPHLRAGERVNIVTRPNASPVPARAEVMAPAAIDEAIAWKNRRLEFTDAPLSEIIADFNRFNQHQLVVADARLAARRFGGTFSVGDHASLVQLLERTFGVVVERREHETVLRLP